MVKRAFIAWLLILLGASAVAQVQSLEKVVADLSSDDRSVREKAVRDLGKRGTGAVKPLVAVMASEDHTAATGARLALQFMAHNASRPGVNAYTREYMAKAFLAEVQGEHPLKIRRWLLRLVSFTAIDNNVPEVAKLLDDEELREMTRWTLERIPGEKSRAALSAAGLEREVITDPGDYELVLRLGQTVKDRCHALDDLVRYQGEESVPKLLEILHDESPELTACAVEGLEGIKGESITRSMAGAVGSVQEATRIQLLLALGRRGDDIALPVLVAATASSSDEVRRAALTALGDLGSPGGANAVIDVVFSSLRDEAGQTLNRIEGEEVTSAIISRVDEGTPDEKAVLLESLGIRGDEAALDTLTAGTRSPHKTVREASIRGLGRLNHAGAVPVLMELIVWEGEDEASRALYLLRDADATRALVAAMEKTPPEAKRKILEALGDRKDTKLTEVFLAATHDMSVDVTVAALNCLGKLADPLTAPRLLEMAQSDWPEEQAAALKAYICIGEKKDSAEAFDLYVDVLAMAVSDDERIMAIDRLGRLNDPKSLSVIHPFLDSGSDKVKEAAATAVAPVAVDLGDVDILKQVVRFSDDPNRIKQAASKLRESGVEVDVPVRKGYIKHFWLLGPLSGQEEVREADLVSMPVDLAGAVRFNDVVHRWVYHPLDDIRGQLDLLDAVAPMDNVGVYTYSEVTCNEALEATFKIGSDDDVYCWLNGERVHAFEGGRGWSADQDSVEISLRKGANAILMKVLNGGGGWAVSLRITDRDGNPLDLRQKSD